jgi:hypothetical protein
MGSMKDLLGDAPFSYPERPGYERPQTSQAAAHSLDADSLRAKVLDFIKSRSDGATSDEVEIALGLRHQTASARIRELVLMGRLRKPGNTRKTSSGRSAEVAYAVGETA